ncbi:MAG TPA: pantoate--beta-alanine ligase [Candidatus Limnocylindria bacterium]|nr:pantoate--beta-alanine ligase [Candidatus Limnocylindria bacterium]
MARSAARGRRMRRVRSVAAVRRAVADWKARGHRIAFVPTMGAIHDGHSSLVRRARTAPSVRVVASIFVNPLQFGPREDYRRYPRRPIQDRARLRAAGVDLLWEPAVADLYPSGHRTRVRVSGVDESLEGASRPGHFEGVATVVLKLLNVVAPDTLWLGQKDAQQAAVLERMVTDLDLPVRVRRAPTVREPDGLALSSRNAYLDRDQRRQAVALPRGLAAARALLREGERSAARLRAAVRRVWRRYPAVREDYVAVVDLERLEPVRRVRGRVLVAVAARVGPARLIDNFEWNGR